MELLVLAVVFYGVGLPILAIANAVRVSDLRSENRRLSERLTALELGDHSQRPTTDGLEAELARDVAESEPLPTSPFSVLRQPKSPPASPAPQPDPMLPTETRPTDPETTDPEATEPGTTEPGTTEPAEKGPSTFDHESKVRPGNQSSFEERLTSHWLVWLGAIAMALGGVFLVKYAMDRDSLNPAVRTAAGFTYGLALVLVGEWLRRRPAELAIAAVRPNQVPQALTAAGLFVSFASVYASFALHDLIPSHVAFAILAGLSLTGLALSLLQGWFVALLGMLGGYLTPLLISGQDPSAWRLFGYLFALYAGAMLTLRSRRWWWMGWANLACAVIWVLKVISEGSLPATDVIPVGSFLALLTGLALTLLPRPIAEVVRSAASEEARQEQVDLGDIFNERSVAAATAVISMLLAVGVANANDYGPASVLLLGLMSAVLFVAARRVTSFELLFPVAAGSVLLSFLLWPIDPGLTLAETIEQSHRGDFRAALGSLLPEVHQRYLWTALAFAIAFGIGGFVSLSEKRRNLLWAGTSAALPILLLATAFERLRSFEQSLGWGVFGLVLALPMFLAALRLARDREKPGTNLAFGLYAAATSAAVTLALTMGLREAWLTVALSMQLPVLASLGTGLRIRSLRVVAWMVASAVLVRLILNPNVLEYSATSMASTGWIIYGYGVPAAAFFWAALRFRRDRDDSLVILLETGALAFVVVLFSMLIRVLIAGEINSPHYELLEQAVHSIVWLVVAYGLQKRAEHSSRLVIKWGWKVLVVLAAAQVFLLQVLAFNPLFRETPRIGPLPFDLLLLAYGIPAVFAFLFFREWRAHRAASRAAVVAGHVLMLVYLSLEVRHAFQGENLDSGFTSTGEWYAYSVVWLIYAGVLLAMGLRLKSIRLRYASLAMILLTVAKLFLFDMAELEGLYRVASFVGLGLALVGIGFIYQRYVFPTQGVDPEQRELERR